MKKKREASLVRTVKKNPKGMLFFIAGLLLLSALVMGLSKRPSLSPQITLEENRWTLFQAIEQLNLEGCPQDYYAETINVVQLALAGGEPETTPPSQKDCIKSCKEVTIACMSQEEINQCVTGAGAICERTTCTLILSKEMCALLNLSTGQKITPGELKKRIKVPFPPSRDPRTVPIDEILDACAVAHETCHAEDPLNLSKACSERNCFTVEKKCLQDFYDQFCRNNPSLEMCQQLKIYICEAQGGISLNQCLCENPNRGTGCQTCFNRCLGATRSCLGYLGQPAEELSQEICKTQRDTYCAK